MTERTDLPLDEDGLITELRLHLRGTIGPGARLTDLLAAAPATRGGCTAGRVDPAGFFQ